MKSISNRSRGVLLATVLLLAACETEAPHATPVGSDAALTDNGVDATDSGATDVITVDAPTTDTGVDGGVACAPVASDYTPRVSMSSTDPWPACISDPGLYVRFDMSTSSITRATAFERIHIDATGGRPAGLFDPTRDPAAEEFTAARMVYLEAEGLDSRVVRRTDEHYPQPTPNNDCRVAEVVTANPDYCAGPARLLPVITANFRDGQVATLGTPQRVRAARIEAALLWFFYISIYKEALTCTTVTADCDSSWAYYTGGVQRAEARYISFARYVQSAEPAAHDRIWDGVLAVRCWRDLDRTTPATNVALRERARDQLDRALTRGIVVVLQARIRAAATAPVAERAAHLAFAGVIGPLLDRAVRVRSAADADRLASVLAAADPARADLDAAVATLDRLFPCP